MKILLLLAALFLAMPAWALDVTVTWAPNAPADGVVGYILCYGETPRITTGWTSYDTCLPQTSEVQSPAVISDTLDTYFAVISVDSAGFQSAYSSEYAYTPPVVPVGPVPSSGITTITADVVDGQGRAVTVIVTVQ